MQRSIIAAVLRKKLADVTSGFKGKAKKAEPVDRGLPLGLHIDSVLELDETVFLLLEGVSKFPSPQPEQKVVAWGKTSFDDEWTIHTFYLQSTTDVEDESLLRIVLDSAGTIVECRLFRTVDRVFPETSGEWGFWIHPETGVIGQDPFQAKDETLYERVWENGQREHIPPYEFKEVIFGDRYEGPVATFEIESMLYGRDLNETKDAEDELPEFILIQSETDVSNNEASVHIMIGVDISPMTSIKVKF